MRRLNSMSRIKSCQSPFFTWTSRKGLQDDVPFDHWIIAISPSVSCFLQKKIGTCLGTYRPSWAILGHLGPFFGASNGAVSQVRLICSFRYVDLDGHGHCRQCPLMIQTAGGPRGEATDQGLKVIVIDIVISYIFFFTTHICICLNTHIYMCVCVCLCIYMYVNMHI